MKVRSLRSKKKKQVTTVVVVAVVVILIGMLVPRLYNIVSSVVLLPFTTMHTWVTTSSDTVPVFVRDRLALRGEINRLENELVIAGGENLTLERLRNENVRLRALLGIESTERLAAAVIARPYNLPYDVLQIDRGSAHGVVVGAPVYIGEDRFLGVIADVAPTYSFVVLVTHPRFSATGFIEGANIIATLDGLGGGVVRIRVPQGVPLSVGDLVHVPSVEPGVFGRIASIENQPTQPEQFGYITPEIPLSSIHLVSVGREPLVPAVASVIEERITSFIDSKLLLVPFSSSSPTSSEAVSSSSETSL